MNSEENEGRYAFTYVYVTGARHTQFERKQENIWYEELNALDLVAPGDTRRDRAGLNYEREVCEWDAKGKVRERVHGAATLEAKRTLTDDMMTV